MTSQTREQRRGWLSDLLAAALFGSSAPLIGSFSHGASPVLVAGLLYAGAALVLLPLALAEAPTSRHAPIQQGDLPLLGLITLLGGIAGPIALVKGLALLTPGASALLLNLEAVFTVLIAVGVGKEHLGREGSAAAALTLSGALVLSAGPLGGSQWQGVLWIALACLCWGIDNNLSQRLSLRNPLQISAAKALGAAVPMLAVANLQGHAIPFAWMSAALLGIGSLGYGVSMARHGGPGRSGGRQGSRGLLYRSLSWRSGGGGSAGFTSQSIAAAGGGLHGAQHRLVAAIQPRPLAPPCRTRSPAPPLPCPCRRRCAPPSSPPTGGSRGPRARPTLLAQPSAPP
jgi:drug/metabolite transporter (DMT)-like permease